MRKAMFVSTQGVCGIQPMTHRYRKGDQVDADKFKGDLFVNSKIEKI